VVGEAFVVNKSNEMQGVALFTQLFDNRFTNQIVVHFLEFIQACKQGCSTGHEQ
jgi:hypothetical protein